MHASLIEHLFGARVAVIEELRAAIQGAPHRLPVGASHAALGLAAVDDAIGFIDRAALPAEMRPMAPRRLAGYIAGRLCAEYALGQLGLDRASTAVPRGRWGQPCWPQGYVGSIAHTDTVAYAVACRASVTSGIGIDSEPIVDAAALRDIRATCCTADENHRLLSDRQGDEASLIATLIFSAKECYYKAIHARVLRFVDFTEAQVQHIDLARQCIAIGPAPGTALVGAAPVVDMSFVVAAGIVHTAAVLDP